jgi:hypothetical protein
MSRESVAARATLGRRYSAAIAIERGGLTVNGQARLIHLRSESELEPKCRATDATSLTNWVRGASFPEVYVPAEIVGNADVVCRKCQEAAIDNDIGSDDEVVSDEEEIAVVQTGVVLADVSDADLLAEIARRLGDEDALAEEEGDQTKDHRD